MLDAQAVSLDARRHAAPPEPRHRADHADISQFRGVAQTLGHDLRETLHIQNCGEATLAIRLDVHFGSRFEHLFDVRSDAPQAGVQRNSAGNGLLAFTYKGIDGRRRNTTISFSPLPGLPDPETASFLLELAPRQVNAISVLKCR